MREEGEWTREKSRGEAMGDRREEGRGAGVGEEGEGERIYGREGRVNRGMVRG